MSLTRRTRWQALLLAGTVALGLLTNGLSQEGDDEVPLVDPPNLNLMEAIEGMEIDAELLEQLAEALGDAGGFDIEMDMRIAQDLPANALINRQTYGTQLSAGRVKTDADTEQLLERAEQFAEQGRYDLASQLWQQAINQSSDALIARQDWQQRTFSKNVYSQLKPMIGEIEASMARSIEGNLSEYQLKIDGDARALLARSTPETRESALAEIVLRYFLSSIGDEAAFELGCLKMERGEFLPAVRLFTKLLDEYPKPDIETWQIEVRLAGSLARVGSSRQALEIVDALETEYPGQARILALVRKDIEEVRAAQGDGLADNQVLQTPMQVQPSLAGTLPASLPIAWRQSFDLTLPATWPVLPESPRDPLPVINQRTTRVRGQFGNNRNNPPSPPTPRNLTDRWREFFMPAGQVLLRDGRAYFKTDDRVVACDAASGSLQWLGFRNSLVLGDVVSRGASVVRGGTQMNENPFPKSAEEYLLFGDRVHQSMTLAGNRLYVLQGQPLDFRDEDPELVENQVQPNQFNRFGNRLRMQQSGRFRENRLVAYAVDSGKLQWYRRAEEEPDPDNPIEQRAGFAASPVPYANLLLVPVHVESSLYLTALDQSTGDTVWRTFLCDEPQRECQPLSPVPISVDAGDAYVGSGTGLLFSVDAISGQLNWAVQYPRQAIAVQRPSQFQPVYTERWKLLDGFTEDRVVPHGNEVMVLGTDFHFAFAVNRRTGKLAWETPRAPFRSPDPSQYVLAVHEGFLYLGGARTVRCYRVRGGKLQWESSLPSRSFARGAFTPKAIYMPLEESIVQLDPKTGRQVAQAQVKVGNGDAPVGNLFSTGEQLIVYGFKRVYGLGPITAALPEEQQEQLN